MMKPELRGELNEPYLTRVPRHHVVKVLIAGSTELSSFLGYIYLSEVTDVRYV